MFDVYARYFLFYNRAEGFFKKVRNILIVFVLLYIYSNIFLYFFDGVFRFGQIGAPVPIAPLPIPLHETVPVVPLLTKAEKFVRSCVLAPLWESIVWIYAVSKLSIAFDEKKTIIPFMIISSVMFGWVHNGAEGVFMQGVCGFFWFGLYLKNNYSLSSCIVGHALWNFSIFFIDPIWFV